MTPVRYRRIITVNQISENGHCGEHCDRLGNDKTWMIKSLLTTLGRYSYKVPTKLSYARLKDGLIGLQSCKSLECYSAMHKIILVRSSCFQTYLFLGILWNWQLQWATSYKTRLKFSPFRFKYSKINSFMLHTVSQGG